MFNDTDYKLIVEDGKQFLTYKGEKLPNQLDSNIVQTLDDSRQGRALCKVTILVHAQLENTI